VKISYWEISSTEEKATATNGNECGVECQLIHL